MLCHGERVRGLLLAGCLVLVAAGPAHAGDRVARGTITIPADPLVRTWMRSLASDAAARAAACDYLTHGDEGQGRLGWVIPLTDGIFFSLDAEHPVVFGQPPRFLLRFYPSLPACGDVAIRHIQHFEPLIPAGATVAIVTSGTSAGVDPLRPPDVCPGDPVPGLPDPGDWLDCQIDEIRSFRPADTAFGLPGAAFIFTES